MGISLSTKVRRPSYYELRNSEEYFNRYEIEAGNPLLLPQYTTDLSYSLQYKRFRFGMNYQWIKDYVMSNNLVLQGNPLIVKSQPFNKPHYSAFGANVSYNAMIGFWEPYCYASIMQTFLDIHDVNGMRVNGQKPYVEVSVNNYFNLKNDFMPYVFMAYNTTGDLREYNVKEKFLLSFGIGKHFLKNSLYLRLNVNNVLGTKEIETRYGSNYIFEKERFKDNRNISLMLRYVFNNKKKYKGNSAASEEINRL